MKNIENNTSLEIKATVEQNMTAEALHSGTLKVLATPAMIAMMENAAMNVLDQFLDAGETSVGTSVNVLHLAPSAISAEIRITAKIVSNDNRTVNFEISAFDKNKEIGRGTHTRVVVDAQRFMSKL